MIRLDEAKEIIRSAGPAGSSDRCLEMDSDSIFGEGWRDLGEDHYYNEIDDLVAGPGEVDRASIWVCSASTEELTVVETEAVYDFGFEWDRQVDTGVQPRVVENETEEQPTRASGASGRCACDT